ncbi:MAG TPA: sialidase family protein [Thermoanaerobaculia bacterium]
MVGRPASALAIVAASFWACAPTASAPRDPGTAAVQAPAPAPAPVADFVRISAAGPGDAALARCLGDPAAARAEVEPHAAVNPRDSNNIVAAWMVRAADGGAIQAAASFDGGRSWTPPATLPVNACSGGPFDFLPRASDPWVAFGPDGRAYVSAIAYKPAESVDEAGAVIVVASPDGGRTWDPPGVGSITRTPEYFHDNTAIAAHPTQAGTVYVVFTRYEPQARLGPAALSRTLDRGRTWSPVRAITPRTPGSTSAGAPQMVIDPRTGHLFVFYTHGPRGSRVSFVKSEDLGQTWSEPVVVTDGVPLRGPAKYPGTDKQLRIAEDIAHAAIDPRTGQLFVVFTDGRFTGGESLQVGITTSVDNGRTWSAPLRVSADSVAASWRPAIAADAQGRVAVTYFAPAGERPRGDALPVAVHLAAIQRPTSGTLARGTDLIFDTFDWKPGRGGLYFLGDYNPLLVARGGFLPVYARPTEGGTATVAAHLR